MQIYRVVLGRRGESLVSVSGFSAGAFRQHCLEALMAGMDTPSRVSAYLVQHYDYQHPEVATVNLERCTHFTD